MFQTDAMQLTSITRASERDLPLLSEIGKNSFIESHGTSAPIADITKYLEQKFTFEVLQEELKDQNNIYYIIYYDKRPAGYSKILFNSPHSNIPQKNVTKLERLYLLKEFYNLKLGLGLLNFNIDLSKRNDQAGMWLFVWKGNPKAFNFYSKNGFNVIGSYDFQLTETHSNPNHQMFLEY